MHNLYDILDETLKKSGPFEFSTQYINIENREMFDIIVYDKREGANPIGIYAVTIYPQDKKVKLNNCSGERFSPGLFMPFLTRMEEEGYVIKE